MIKSIYIQITTALIIIFLAGDGDTLAYEKRYNPIFNLSSKPNMTGKERGFVPESVGDGPVPSKVLAKEFIIEELEELAEQNQT